MGKQKSLDARWMDMTFGTYLAIQNVLNKPEWKEKNVNLSNNYAFKLLCELKFNEPLSITNLREMGPESLLALEYLANTGLIEESTIVSTTKLGHSFMDKVKDEIKSYLGRDLIKYKLN